MRDTLKTLIYNPDLDSLTSLLGFYFYMNYIKVDYEEISCLNCSGKFKPNRADKKFCSKACYKKYGKKFKGHSNGDSSLSNLKLQLKRRPYILEKLGCCKICGFIAEHSCQLDIDHIDGDHKNNCKDNLQTICANCHRLKTATQLNWKNKPYQKLL